MRHRNSNSLVLLTSLGLASCGGNTIPHNLATAQEHSPSKAGSDAQAQNPDEERVPASQSQLATTTAGPVHLEGECKVEAGTSLKYAANYDKLGRLQRTYLEDGYHPDTTLFTYTTLGGTVVLARKDIDGHNPVTITYYYDADQKLIREVYVEDTPQPTLYEYDSRNNLIRETNASQGRQIEYGYDERDNRTSHVQSSLNWNSGVMIEVLRVTETYDENGHIVRRTRTVDDVTWVSEYQRNSSGRLAVIVREDENIRFEYNDKGQLELRQVVAGGDTSVVRYEYDDRGNLITWTDDQDDSRSGKATYTSLFRNTDCLGELLESRGQQFSVLADTHRP